MNIYIFILAHHICGSDVKFLTSYIFWRSVQEVFVPERMLPTEQGLRVPGTTEAPVLSGVLEKKRKNQHRKSKKNSGHVRMLTWGHDHHGSVMLRSRGNWSAFDSFITHQRSVNSVDTLSFKILNGTKWTWTRWCSCASWQTLPSSHKQNCQQCPGAMMPWFASPLLDLLASCLSSSRRAYSANRGFLHKLFRYHDLLLSEIQESHKNVFHWWSKGWAFENFGDKDNTLWKLGRLALLKVFVDNYFLEFCPIFFLKSQKISRLITFKLWNLCFPVPSLFCPSSETLNAHRLPMLQQGEQVRMFRICALRAKGWDVQASLQREAEMIIQPSGWHWLCASGEIKCAVGRRKGN